MFDSERFFDARKKSKNHQTFHILEASRVKTEKDNPKCYKRLERLVEGFQIAPPMAFILCGDYLDNPHSPDAFQTLKEVNSKSLTREIFSKFSGSEPFCEKSG